MERQDPRAELIRTIHMMVSRVTKAVQVTPFIYSSIFVIVYFLYSFVDEKVMDIIDMGFYISPLVMVIFLVYSRILHLCKWHRITCVLPLVPQIYYILDSVFTFSQDEILVANILTVIMLIILLISAYKVFYRCKTR